MPPVSEAQRRAMYAAKAGKSTLGIPKKVGAEFVAADKGGNLPKKKTSFPPKRKGYALGGDVGGGVGPRDELAEMQKLADKQNAGAFGPNPGFVGQTKIFKRKT